MESAGEHRIRCGEIWGGHRDERSQLGSAGVAASLYSRAADGGRGGDVYYLSTCDDDMLTRAAVADVVGHGSAVAEVGRWLYEALRERIGRADEDAEILVELNELAVARGVCSLASVALASYYRETRRAHFAYAGHAPALLYRAASGRWEPVDVPHGSQTDRFNAPLGVVAGVRFDCVERVLSSGDRILLFTDGISEARSASGEPFATRALAECLAQHTEQPLPALCNRVVAAAQEHAGGSLAADDATLVLLEIL